MLLQNMERQDYVNTNGGSVLLNIPGYTRFLVFVCLNEAKHFPNEEELFVEHTHQFSIFLLNKRYTYFQKKDSQIIKELCNLTATYPHDLIHVIHPLNYH